MMVWLPAVRLLRVMVAWPFVSVIGLPLLLLSSWNWTLPVGVPLAALIVAVKVTGWLTSEVGAWLELRAAVVGVSVELPICCAQANSMKPSR